MGEYIVKKGDTLSAISRKLGVPVSEISGYRSGNPDLIYPGEKLSTKGATAPLGGLGGTIKDGGGVALEGQDRTLPTAQPGNLSVFKDLMRQITDKYSQASTMTGLGSATGMLGVSPEAISGRSLAGIVDFVKGQTTPGIADIYTSTINMMESSRKEARDNLSLLLNTNAFGGLELKEVEQIAEGTGMPYDQLLSIWNSQKVNELTVNSYIKAIEEGKMDITNVPAANRDAVVQGVNWEKIKSPLTWVNPDTNEDMDIYQAAAWIVKENPKLSEDELRLQIRQNIKGLQETDIKNIISINKADASEGDIIRNSYKLFSQWKDLGMSKKDIEKQWRIDNKHPEKAEMSEPEKSTLEAVFNKK